MPAKLPAAAPASRVRRIDGRSDIAAGSRSLTSHSASTVASRWRSAARIPSVEPADLGASPASRSRSNSWYTSGVAKPPSAMATTQCQACPGASTGLTCYPRPVPSAVPPSTEEWHVRSEHRRHPGQVLPAKAGAPQGIAGYQRRRGVGAATSQAGGERNLLAQVQSRVRLSAGGSGKRLDRADDEVGVVEGERSGPFAVHGEREHVRRSGGDLVEDTDRVIDSGHLVVAVRPSGPRRDAEINLGPHPNLHGPHGRQSRTVTVLPQGFGHRAACRVLAAVISPPYRGRRARRRPRRWPRTLRCRVPHRGR